MFLNVTSTGDPCWLITNGFSLNGAYTHGFTFAWSYYSVFVYGPSFGVKICIVTCIFYSYALIKDDVITTQIPPLVNTVERTLENASWGRYFPTGLFNHTTLWRSFQSLWGTRHSLSSLCTHHKGCPRSPPGTAKTQFLLLFPYTCVIS